MSWLPAPDHIRREELELFLHCDRRDVVNSYFERET